LTGRLRITGGALARRLFAVPPAADRGLLRPTSDKVRAALCASLEQRVGFAGRVVLDLCCGSGALGFEALSRGAARCTFVDVDRQTLRVVEQSARALGVLDRCRFVVDDVARFARAGGASDVVFCDPPYAMQLSDDARTALAGLVVPGGVLVLERAARAGRGIPADPPSASSFPGLFLVDERRYGDTRILVAARPGVDDDGAREDAGGSEDGGDAAAAVGAGVDDEGADEDGADEGGADEHGTGAQQREAAMAGGHIQRAAVYPGSFDPLTNGHVDIIERGLRMFDRVVLAVANNPQKQHFFSAEERIALARASLGERPGLEFEAFDGLVVDFARRKGVNVLLRGVRAVSDFEYEFQLAGMNRKLSGVETVFMATSEESFYVASRLVREVASFGGDVSSMVPAPVLAALTERHRQKLASKKS
jgi:pantetheine-phosphate adenylyltransferase